MSTRNLVTVVNDRREYVIIIIMTLLRPYNIRILGNSNSSIIII